MCPTPVQGGERKPGKKGEERAPSPADKAPADYSHIFSEMETAQYVHRGMLLRRLLQDPFYKAMNITPPARLWMLRHLAHVLEHVEHAYNLNLLQFSHCLGRETLQNFMKFKNAPKEMFTVLDEIFPATPAASAASDASDASAAVQRTEPEPAPKEEQPTDVETGV